MTRYEANRMMIELLNMAKSTDEFRDEFEEAAMSGDIQAVNSLLPKLNKLRSMIDKQTKKSYNQTIDRLEDLTNGGSLVEEYMEEAENYLLEDTEWLQNLKVALANLPDSSSTEEDGATIDEGDNNNGE